MAATAEGLAIPKPGARELETLQSRPEFIEVAVTVAAPRDENGEAGVQSYSKTGGECGIRTRGGGFADLCLTTWLTRHRPSQSHSLVGAPPLPVRLSPNLSAACRAAAARGAHNHASCGDRGSLWRG